MQQVIMWIMAIGAVIGGIDRLIGNKLKLGEKFEEGFNLMGPIALSMAGILCLVPLLSQGLGSVVAPLCTALGLDPSVFATILANDMGGYAMSVELAADPLFGAYAGSVVAAIFGCTLSFSLPVGMGMLIQEDRPLFARGILYGLLSMPVALIIGGILSGLNFADMLWKLSPILLLSVILLVGIWKKTDLTVKIFTAFAAVIRYVITVGLILGAVQSMTGLALIPGLAPIEDAMAIVSATGIVLLGSLPVSELLRRALKKPLTLLGNRLGMDEVSMTGLLLTPVSVLPTIAMMKDMNTRGKIVNAAAAVCTTAALSSHLGFTIAQAPHMLPAVLTAKIVGGVLGAVIAIFATRPGK